MAQTDRRRAPDRPPAAPWSHVQPTRARVPQWCPRNRKAFHLQSRRARRHHIRAFVHAPRAGGIWSHQMHLPAVELRAGQGARRDSSSKYFSDWLDQRKRPHPFATDEWGNLRFPCELRHSAFCRNQSAFRRFKPGVFRYDPCNARVGPRGHFQTNDLRFPRRVVSPTRAEPSPLASGNQWLPPQPLSGTRRQRILRQTSAKRMARALACSRPDIGVARRRGVLRPDQVP